MNQVIQNQGQWAHGFVTGVFYRLLISIGLAQSDSSGHDNTASFAFDFFHAAAIAKPKGFAKHLKIVEPQPAKQLAKLWG